MKTVTYRAEDVHDFAYEVRLRDLKHSAAIVDALTAISGIDVVSLYVREDEQAV